MDSIVLEYFLTELYDQMPFLDPKIGHRLFHSFPDYQQFYHTVVVLHVRLKNFV